MGVKISVGYIKGFLEKNGWIQTSTNNHYAFYSPPREMGFNEGYSLPILLSDNQDSLHQRVIEETLKTISNFYGQDVNKLLFDIDSYVDVLRSNSMFFKLESNEVIFDRTLNVQDIWTFLRNLSTSYSAFLKTKFQLDFFGSEIPEKEVKHYEKSLGNLMKVSKLRLIDLKYQSFSFGVAVDTVMGNDKFHLESIPSWRKEIVPSYENEVIEAKLEEKEEIERLLSKYDDKSRRAIFSPIFKSLKNDNLSIYKTTNDFDQKKILKRPDDTTLDIITPKTVQDDNEKREIELYQIVLPIDKSKSAITFKTNTIETDLFSQKAEVINWKIETISFADEVLNFKFPLEISITYDQEESEFNVEFEPLMVDFNVKEFNEIGKELSSQIMSRFLSFKDLIEKKRLEIPISGEEQIIQDFFEHNLQAVD